MTQFGEAISIPVSGHEPDKCCFCPIETKKNPKNIAKIGKDNNSSTLGINLTASGDPIINHLFEDSVHGMYSAEAHHIICGNEILGEEKEVEKYLITQNKKTTKGSEGYIENTLHDVAWDVNSARNGIWLPSVPDMYRVVDGDPDVWWGKQSKKSGREFLKESEKNDIAFIVMTKVKRQFHKGSHTSAAPPHQSYVKLGIRELKKVRLVLEYYSKECPMEDGDEKKRDKAPYRPPHKIAHTLDLLSDRLERELCGAPASWEFFISKLALKCCQWQNG